MKYCKGYIGVNCVFGNCPNAQEYEEYHEPIKCEDCFYYQGCKDCAAPFYGVCPEGKTEE